MFFSFYLSKCMIVVKYFKSNLNNFLHNVKFVNNKLNKKKYMLKKKEIIH